MPSVFIKCALKLIKVMEEVIEQINLDKIIVLIHELLCTTVRNENSNSYDELIIIMIKSAIDKFVQLKGEGILDNYSMVRDHPQEDKYILRWIEKTLPNVSKAPVAQKKSIENSDPGSTPMVQQPREEQKPRTMSGFKPPTANQ